MKTRFSIIILLTTAQIFAKTWFVDPQSGSPDGDGSALKPWYTLQQVIDSGLVQCLEGEKYPYKWGMPLRIKNQGAPVKGGDTLILNTGYHGAVFISRCYNENYITVMANKNHYPRLKNIRLLAASKWRFIGLKISPEYAQPFEKVTLFSIESHNNSGPAREIEVLACTLFSASNISKWTKDDWNNLSCNGFSVRSNRCLISNNTLRNVNFGISVDGDSCLIENNIVENFAGDGLRGVGDYCRFSHNTIMNCYAVNQNHDDGFQSWSVGDSGVGTGVVKGIVLSGNTFINYTDPDQPFRGTLQGIGCFDGFFEDWVIENNVVITDHWHGITLLGAKNCRIINNTVCDLNSQKPGPPWIKIGKHKNGSSSSGCLIRNNLSTSISIEDSQSVESDHNVKIDDPYRFFADYDHLDLQLKTGCPAIDAAISDKAPSVDIRGTARPLGNGVDAGAFEYNSISPVLHKKDQSGKLMAQQYRLSFLGQTIRSDKMMVPFFQLNGQIVNCRPGTRGHLPWKTVVSKEMVDKEQ